MSGPQPLQLTEMQAYMKMFPGFDVEYFVDIIIMIDGEFLKSMDKIQEKENKLEEERAQRKNGNNRRKH